MGILLLVAVSLAAIASIAVLLSFDSTSTKLLKRMDQIMYDISGVQASTDALNVAVTSLQTTVGQMETNIDHLLLAINDPLDHDATASAFVIKQLNGISAALTETSRSLVAFHAPIITAANPVTSPTNASYPNAANAGNASYPNVDPNSNLNSSLNSANPVTQPNTSSLQQPSPVGPLPVTPSYNEPAITPFPQPLPFQSPITPPYSGSTGDPNSGSNSTQYDTQAQAVAATNASYPNVQRLDNGKFCIWSSASDAPGTHVYP